MLFASLALFGLGVLFLGTPIAIIIVMRHRKQVRLQAEAAGHTIAFDTESISVKHLIRTTNFGRTLLLILIGVLLLLGVSLPEQLSQPLETQIAFLGIVAVGTLMGLILPVGLIYGVKWDLHLQRQALHRALATPSTEMT
jgi:hypothetical protein